jgi:hypothetical protein
MPEAQRRLATPQSPLVIGLVVDPDLPAEPAMPRRPARWLRLNTPVLSATRRGRCGGRREEMPMRVEELSGATAAVYRAVAEREDHASAPHLQDIAHQVGLSLEETRAAVHALLHSEPKILHEVPDTSRTDLGPVYELAPRT